MLKITGTFLDEITWDIPPQNWDFADWHRDFDAMQAIGIDTVIIIRGGLRDKTVFPSKEVGRPGKPACGTGRQQDYDLAKFFLEEAAARNMQLFFGTYDSAIRNQKGDWQAEYAINQRFIREVWERYGSYPSFAGWYLAQEYCRNRFPAREIYQHIGGFCKELTPDRKVLISPYYPSRKIFPEDFLTPAQFGEDWFRLLKGIDCIDYCAFQDGTASLAELPDYLAAAKSFCAEYRISLWNNVETFSRDFPIKFPPIDFRELQEKLAISSGFAEKNITFEFSHFLSPNSCYPAAHHLYRRYREWFGL